MDQTEPSYQTAAVRLLALRYPVEDDAVGGKSGLFVHVGRPVGVRMILS